MIITQFENICAYNKFQVQGAEDEGDFNPYMQIDYISQGRLNLTWNYGLEIMYKVKTCQNILNDILVIYFRSEDQRNLWTKRLDLIIRDGKRGRSANKLLHSRNSGTLMGKTVSPIQCSLNQNIQGEGYLNQILMQKF